MLGKNKTLGILGGGQLGKMVLDVSNRWGLKVYVLDSNIECPSSKLCSKFFVGDLMDFDTVVQFGQNVDLITIEIENVNVEALKFLESKGKKVFPQPRVIEIIQDKSKQKEFYIDNEIPTSSFRSCNGIEELKSLISKGEISYPFIWKASKMGYDGYGVNKISDNKSLEKLSDCHCIVEELISIKKELSVMVGLRESGEILNYPVVEMEFNKDSNQVEYILSPAQISQELKIKAEKLACNIAEKFKICGIIAVEMFLTNQDEILVNEVAPRPHNSAHYSIEGCINSQFDQHISSILNLPLGCSKSSVYTIMANLVGDEGYNGDVIYEGIDEAMKFDNVKIHIYGKKETKPNRKMGHITVIDTELESGLKRAKNIKELIKIKTN